MNWQPLSLLLVLSACNSFAFSAEDKTTVIIKGFKFIPQEITIKQGQRVHWHNKEKRQYHSVWFETSGEEEPDYFFPDESFSRKFKQTGAFPYRCGPHPEMTGIVHVTN